MLTGLADIQLVSEGTAPSLRVHITARATVDSGAPHSDGHGGKAPASFQVIITHADVGMQVFVLTGLNSPALDASEFVAQLASEVAIPSLPMHFTARVTVDKIAPHSVGHAGNASGSHLYVTHAAVAAHTIALTGLAAVQLSPEISTIPSLLMQRTSRITVASGKPHVVRQSEKAVGSQLYRQQLLNTC